MVLQSPHGCKKQPLLKETSTMHKGEIRETSTHQDLLAQRDLYWRLYQLQFY
jgi:ABC-type bacteriocin/lantibiotic exporter with double-glycine peptidase domain